MFAEPTQARRILHLTSSKNPLLKEVRRAADRGTLTTDGLCVAESFHLLEEAIRSGCDIPAVIAAEGLYSTVERRVKGLRNVRVFAVQDDLFAGLSSTESNQGVMALVRPPTWDIDQLFRGRSLVLVIDGVQDPGNAGSMLRAAEAFGATGVMLLKGSVSPFNTKAMRASAGSVFRVPFVTGIEGPLALAALSQRRLDLYASMPRAQKTIAEVDLRRRCGFIIGNEGQGVNPRLASSALDVRIPTHAVESLNAAVATGILLYECWRQRQIPE